ncbi:MAG: hypothetical protein IPL88_02015 [Rhizobiales bacterium]|nr:hypothetical protein [Hyphomicrobiales bacterium]
MFLRAPRRRSMRARRSGEVSSRRPSESAIDSGTNVSASPSRIQTTNGDPALREKTTGLKLRRDELARQVADTHRSVARVALAVAPAKLAVLLRDRLREGAPELRQAYVRLVMSEVTVTGSKSVLAKAAAADAEILPPAVLSLVRKWRARRDSNP